MMKLNVRMKLLATSCVLLLGALVIAFVSIVSLGNVNGQADRAYVEGTTAIEKLAAMDTALIDKARVVTYAVIVGDNAD